MNIVGRRITEAISLAAIGDGMMALVRPREHIALWRGGPEWWDKSLEPFARRPGLTRVVGAAGILFGIWLASRQEDSEREAA